MWEGEQQCFFQMLIFLNEREGELGRRNKEWHGQVFGFVPGSVFYVFIFISLVVVQNEGRN